jgi:hypothetical protein
MTTTTTAEEDDTYEGVKRSFERTCFKVRSPFAYAVVMEEEEESGARSTRTPDLYSAAQLRQRFANKYYYHYYDAVADNNNTNNNEEDEGGPHKRRRMRRRMLFIKRWMADPCIREVQRVVVDPTTTETMTRKRPPIVVVDDPQHDYFYYNLWRGFKAAQLPMLAPDETSASGLLVVERLMAPLIAHVDAVLTGGNAAHTGWLLDYWASLVQRPQQKTQVALSLFGRQGCGKGLLFDFLRDKVLGPECSYQTAHPEHDLLARFANGFVGCVLVQVDEAQGSLRAHGDRLKNLITSRTLSFERKGHDQVVVANFCNLVFTSNHEGALAVSPDDRRFALFRCTDARRGDHAYFRALSAHLARPEVARACYVFLRRRDLRAYPHDFQASRPVTAYYLEAQRASLSPVARFLSALANDLVQRGEASSPLGIDIAAHAFYRRYVEFHVAGGYRGLRSDNAFSREVTRVDGIERRRVSSGVLYAIQAARVRAHLELTNEYDADASLFTTTTPSSSSSQELSGGGGGVNNTKPPVGGGVGSVNNTKPPPPLPTGGVGGVGSVGSVGGHNNRAPLGMPPPLARYRHSVAAPPADDGGHYYFPSAQASSFSSPGC